MTLKQILDHVFKDVKFDKKLYVKLIKHKNTLVTKNVEHAEFFGGVLTGTNTLRHTDSDENKVLHEILDIDTIYIKTNRVHVDELNPKWVVANDVFNLCMAYCMYRFMNSNIISKKMRSEAAELCSYLLHFKSICAKHTQYFKYPVSKQVATAAYEHLSNKFLIRKLDSWEEVTVYRAKSILHNTSHKTVISRFGPDKEVIYLLSNMNNQINSMFRKIFRVTADIVVTKKSVTLSTLAETTPDGVEVFGETKAGFSSYTDYILSIVHDKHSFIKEDLINVTLDVMPVGNYDHVSEVLLWMSEHVFSKHTDEINDFIRGTIEHAFTYLYDNGLLQNKHNDISVFVNKLKGAYTSSRSSNAALLDLRDKGTKIIKQASKRNNTQLVNSTRTVLMLYLFLRAYARNLYT